MRSIQYRMRSAIAFVSPYTLPGMIGCSSSMGMRVGWSNRLAVELRMKRFTACSQAASITFCAVCTFSRRYRNGFCMLSPT